MTRILKGLGRTVLLAGAAAFAGGGGAPAGELGLALGERENHGRAGETVTRTVILTNTGATTAAVRLDWRLAAPPALIDAGTAALDVPPRESRRLALRLRLPPVRRPADLDLAVQAAGGEPPLPLLARLRVYPGRQEVPWAFLARCRLGVYDPRGGLRARLRALGGKPRELFSPEEAGAFDGDLLLLGESSLDDAAAWMALRQAQARRGARLPVLRLAQRWRSPATGGAGAVVRPVDFGHPLLRLLDPGDLFGWPAPPLEAWVPAASAAAGAALLEETQAGSCRVLYCQVPLLGRWDAEPACEPLLSAMMRYALAHAAPPGARDERMGAGRAKKANDKQKR